MLPSLGALSSAPTGAQDDVITEILAERREMAIREVLSKDDLVEEILVALDQGNSWEACKLAVRWCSLNKARRAACDDHIWDDLGALIWGAEALQLWSTSTPRNRFHGMCVYENELRRGVRSLISSWELTDVKRFVLAGIAGTDYYRTLEQASERLQDDEEVVRAAIAKDARAIRFASPRLQARINPLRPTEYWPKGEPTDFERVWGDAVLHIMMREQWETLTLKKIRLRLAQEHPEFDTAYWIGHKPELKVLVQEHLRPHMMDNIPALENE